ncbi:AraC family transcriptional regulator [Polaribacter sp. Z014]|uniref:AraC family transcriptional regulator n=1 Tax=Polaribacter sp. Z014 TaxID=2927126 RepID=UPI0020229B3D|nr:AraC family transcriptional regulator [Polaribacter sp. Z014]MCL7762963.1 AraC family transcriptional regulator [Polaribacter sp. Z014]
MRLVLKQSDTLLNKKLNVSKRVVPSFDVAWHHHKEIELLYISQSNGIRFVGDNVSPFFPGDLVLVGSHLPHLWRSDPSYYEMKSNRSVKTIVIKFTKDFLGKDFFKREEFFKLERLLEASKFGLSFDKEVSSLLHKDLMSLPDLSSTEQHIALLGVLHKLSTVKEESVSVLSSSDMRQSITESSEKIDLVLRFISDNYTSNLSLEEVSGVACMTTNSFCRFFKKMTNKSFTQFLNEIRIRNASRILIQENLSVSEVCYLVGFNSMTYFNKQFKQIMGTTPKTYKVAIY